MCGRLVNLDTVARVLADYYHLKTDTQLAALNEALSRVPAETVGKELFGNSEQLDTISRQAAISICDNAIDLWNGQIGTGALIAVRDAIKALPSAQPRWIPWDSGKFPKESGTYTVTAYDGNGSRVTFAKYQKRLKRWELTVARAYWRVLAWMEKPEPWKGEQHGTSRAVLSQKPMR